MPLYQPLVLSRLNQFLKLSRMVAMVSLIPRLHFLSRIDSPSNAKEVHPADGQRRLGRRRFLQLAGFSTVAGAVGPYLLHLIKSGKDFESLGFPGRAGTYEDLLIDEKELATTIGLIRSPDPFSALASVSGQASSDDYLIKVRHFDHHYIDDFYLSERQLSILVDTYSRMERVQLKVGHGNFSVLGFDQMLSWAEQYEEVGAFPREEKNLMDMIFHEDASRYGFFGSKLSTGLTESIARKSLKKIPGAGQRLYKGHSEELFHKLKKDIGPDLILTSGVRGIPKQIHLFLAKAIASAGNLSRASRSLAPPGYSWHGVGDFDVGKRGYGLQNFTGEFTKTGEYKKLCQLGYVKARYPQDNLLGVRFEPWHISTS